MTSAWAGEASESSGHEAAPSLAEAVFITKAERAALERRFADGQLTDRDHALMEHWRRLAPEAAAWRARSWEAGDNLYRGAWLVEAADYTPERGWASVQAAGTNGTNGTNGGVLVKALEKAWTQNPRPGFLERDNPNQNHGAAFAPVARMSTVAKNESSARKAFIAPVAWEEGVEDRPGSPMQTWRGDDGQRLASHYFTWTDGRRRASGEAKRMAAAHHVISTADASPSTATVSHFIQLRHGYDGFVRHAYAAHERRAPDWNGGWNPDADALLFIAGESVWSQEDFKKSAALWARLSTDFPRAAETWCRVAKAADASADVDAGDVATTWWKRILEHFPDTHEGREAAERLNETIPFDPLPPAMTTPDIF